VGKPNSRNKRSVPGTIRVAMVNGTGSAGVLHFPSLLQHPRVDFTAVTHRPGSRLESIATREGLNQYQDFVEMVKREHPDAVYVTVPPLERFDVVSALLELGCHTFVMKPPSLTTDQIRQMALLARKQGLLTGVVFYRRFSDVVRKGKQLCTENGEVHTAVASFYKYAVGAGPYSRGGIDILTSDAIHGVDTLRYLCGGRVEGVFSNVRKINADHHNAFQAIIKFSSGRTGVLLANWMSGRRMFTVEVHGPGVSCFGDLEEGGRIFKENKTDPVSTFPSLGNQHDTEYYRTFGIPEINIPKTGWHKTVNDHFIDCILANRQPETCFQDALETMELVDAIYNSQI